MNRSHTFRQQPHTSKDATYNSQPPADASSRKTAFLLGIILIGVAVCSSLWIITRDRAHTDMIADIYQNGERIQSIPLTAVTDTYSFTITGEHGAENTVEIHQGSIGIIAANCPDKLCVHQGFITDSRLPITCLPNRLVIQLRAKDMNSEITPDIITY